MTKLKMLLLVFFAFFISFSVRSADLGQNKLQAEVLGHFRFDGNAEDASGHKHQFQLKNTQFKDKALYLNGKYELNGTPDGYRAVCATPSLSDTSFTVVIRFKADSFESRTRNILTGGVAYRWFGMHRAKTGNLSITLNNQQFSHEITNATLQKDKWTVIASGVDLVARKIMVYLNGKETTQIGLPKDFKLAVTTSNKKKSDKVWTFTNYSNMTVFHGLVDELIIYNRMLPSDEFSNIRLRP
jgi:hypothetical protein